MSSRRRSDGSGSAAFGVLFVFAILWWLRWFILAAAVVVVLVLVTRWALRYYAHHRAAERARLAAIRQRAELQNAQVLHGDPAGFFGQYPLPNRELIPTWYTGGASA